MCIMSLEDGNIDDDNKVQADDNANNSETLANQMSEAKTMDFCQQQMQDNEKTEDEVRMNQAKEFIRQIASTLETKKPGEKSGRVVKEQVRLVVGDLESVLGELQTVVGDMRVLVHQIDAVTDKIDEEYGSQFRNSDKSTGSSSDKGTQSSPDSAPSSENPPTPENVLSGETEPHSRLSRAYDIICKRNKWLCPDQSYSEPCSPKYRKSNATKDRYSDKNRSSDTSGCVLSSNEVSKETTPESDYVNLNLPLIPSVHDKSTRTGRRLSCNEYFSCHSLTHSGLLQCMLDGYELSSAENSKETTPDSDYINLNVQLGGSPLDDPSQTVADHYSTKTTSLQRSLLKEGRPGVIDNCPSPHHSYHPPVRLPSELPSFCTLGHKHCTPTHQTYDVADDDYCGVYERELDLKLEVEYDDDDLDNSNAVDDGSRTDLHSYREYNATNEDRVSLWAPS